MKTLTGDALLPAVDGEAWRAANKADELRLARRDRQAVLMDRAAQFWRDLFDLASNGLPLSRNQQFALNYVAAEGRKRTWGQA